MSRKSNPDYRAAASALRELPEPAPEAAELSERLRTRIEAAIREAGFPGITFARFMELALYAPGLGYYSAGSRKLGAEGDFVTAPELSQLFSRCLARQCAEILPAVDEGIVFEVGAGSGVMASDLLAELEALDTLPTAYWILELSADLRERQRQTIGEKVPHLADRVHWLDRWPAEPFEGVVVANELIDAMPVHRFRVGADGVEELYVGSEEDRLVEHWGAPSTPGLRSAADAIVSEHRLFPGYASEVNLAAVDWIAALGGVLRRGAALIVDYGFPASEYYHPQRLEGTLMCHYRHRAHQDPYRLLGLQDITAHVDFTALAEAAAAAGLKVAGFANQANFLLATGLAEMVTPRSGRERLELTGQVKRLTLPGEMGELFKVLALTRGIDGPLRGFSLRDDRGRL